MPAVAPEVADVPFPLKGVNVATEYDLQPALTTPAGVNVRAFEALAQRGRGGSRPGLTKYVPEKVPGGGDD